MSRDPDERSSHRRLRWLAERGLVPDGGRLRRQDLLGRTSLVLLLAALTCLVLVAPSLRLPYRLAALSILALWALVPLLLRLRYRAAL